MQFDKLDRLGYSGIGFGFLEDDVHCVGTPKASTVLSDPRLIEYLKASGQQRHLNAFRIFRENGS